MKRSTLFLIIGLLILLALVPSAAAQYRELSWWSLPWGDQTTCGGPDFGTQTHFYEWRGERPEFIYILVTGPNTWDFQNGVWIPHYRVTNVFPDVWEWDVQNCGADFRECWIIGRLKDSMWVDEDNHTVPIGYEIELHFLDPGVYAHDHLMAAYYGPGDVVTINAGQAEFTAGQECYHEEVYMPVILK